MMYAPPIAHAVATPMPSHKKSAPLPSEKAVAPAMQDAIPASASHAARCRPSMRVPRRSLCEPQLSYGAGGMQPVPPVSQWQAGLSGPPITWAVVLTTTRPAVISPWRKSRKALSLGGLIEYAPQCPPVLLSQTRWNTNWTQSVDWVSVSAFRTYDASVESLVDVLGLGGVRVA